MGKIINAPAGTGSVTHRTAMTVIADVLKKKIHVQFNEYTVSSLVTYGPVKDLRQLAESAYTHVEWTKKKLINNKTLF